MDRIFMDEYYEHLRADNIETFSKERNDEYVGRAEEYKAAKSALLEGLGLEHLFDHSHELTPKEKEIWMLFDRVDVAELLARDAFAKGAYMLGAEDREIILRFREDHIVKGISCNDFPAYRLLKRTPQELDNLFNGLVADIGGNGLSGLGRHRLGFL